MLRRAANVPPAAATVLSEHRSASMNRRALSGLSLVLVLVAAVVVFAAPSTRQVATEAQAIGTALPPAHAAPQTDYWSLILVFILSSFIGLGVIARVSRLLHTPLMSITN